LTLTAPADSNTVPPGDYLLFVVDSASVPSVARWVRIGGIGARPPYCASCVVTAPSAAPRPLALFAPRPNPSGPTSDATRILFDLPARTRVRLDIMDAGGRRVRTLADGPLDAGRSMLAWDRRDDRGARLGAGVYFIRLGSQGRWLTRKLVLL
jgi:hypothetical protein